MRSRVISSPGGDGVAAPKRWGPGWGQRGPRARPQRLGAVKGRPEWEARLQPGPSWAPAPSRVKRAQSQNPRGQNQF